MRVAPQPEGVNRVGTREYAVFLTRDVCARDVSGAAVHALPLSTPLRVTLLAIALVSGCEPSLEADLLSVDDVAPRRVEPGRTLAITGAGFPPGRAARVRLEGQLHLPGASPRPIVLLAEGRATAADAIEVRFDDDAPLTMHVDVVGQITLQIGGADWLGLLDRSGEAGLARFAEQVRRLVVHVERYGHEGVAGVLRSIGLRPDAVGAEGGLAPPH